MRTSALVHLMEVKVLGALMTFSMLLLLVGSTVAHGLAAQQAPNSFDEVGDCPVGATRLIGVLSDEADDARIAPVADFIAQLASISDQRIEVLVAAASPEFQPVATWERATPGSADRLVSYLRQAVAASVAPLSLADGLEGLSGELSRRAEAIGDDDTEAVVCSLVVVVSGGETELSDVGALCAAGGPVAQLHDAGAALWATTPLPSEAFAAVTARGCGTTARDAGFHSVTAEPVQLASELAVLVGKLRQASVVTVDLDVCAEEVCAAGRHVVELPPTLDRFSVTVLLPSDSARLVVGLPRGVAIPIDDRVSQPIAAGSYTIQSTWISPHVVRLVANVDPSLSDWSGTWSFTVVEPDPDIAIGAGASLVAMAEVGLRPQLTGSARLAAGRTVVLTAHVVDSEHRVVDQSDVTASITLDGVLLSPDGVALGTVDFEPATSGRWIGRVTVPDDLDPAGGRYAIELTARLSSATLVLPDVVERIPVTVVSGAQWLVPVDSTVTLQGDADGEARGSIRFQADDGVEGCAWIETQSVVLGERESRLRFGDDARSPASCAPVPAGGSTDVPFAIDLSGLGEGGYTGIVTVAFGPRDDSTYEYVEISVNVQVLGPIDTARRIQVAVGMSLIALVTPLIALWILDWIKARFRPSRRAVTADVWISVWADDSIYRVDTDGSPLMLSNDLFEPAQLKRSRRFEWRGLDFKVRNATSPLSPPVGTVGSRTGPVVGSEGAIIDEDTVVGRVPMNLSSAWIFALDPEATKQAASDPGAPDFFAAYGRLVVIRPSLDTDPVDLSELARLAHRLARTVRSARYGDIGTAQEMLDFVDVNVSTPRDLPRKHQRDEPDESAETLRSRTLPTMDPYDFSDLAELFTEDSESDEVAEYDLRAQAAATSLDAAGLASADEEPEQASVGESDDAPAGPEIVFEPELNPSAFLGDDAFVSRARAPEPGEMPPTEDEGDTEAEPSDSRLGWARRAKPSWPTPRSRKEP